MGTATVGPHCVVTTADQHLHAIPQKGQPAALSQSKWLELIGEAAAAAQVRDAAIEIVNRLPVLLGGGRVAIGLAPRGKKCRLVAITGMATFDRHSALARAHEAAMDEVMLAESLPGDATALPRRAQQHVVQQAHAKSIVAVPLHTPREKIVGVLLWFGAEQQESLAPRVRATLQTVAAPLAAALDAVSRAQRGALARGYDSLQEWLSRRSGRTVAVAVVLAMLALAVPIRYRIAGEATVEPVVRRYVTAPFEATLKSTKIRPGDYVHRGQVLAELDGHEIRWELAGLSAEIQRAQKQRDAALAGRDAAAAEIARLEIEQREQRRALLEHRSDHLTIKSPIDGVVTIGDLEKIEGARVTIGQTLFEVAPLETMIVEIAIPEEEIGRFDDDAPVEIRVDAYPGRIWSGRVDTVRPRSEIRDGDNVFIAEVRLDNTDGSLHPGMSCRAKVEGPRAALGWCLFHQSFAAAARWLGW